MNIIMMQVVWLGGNPLSEEPEYRNKVTRILTQISKLDNIGQPRFAKHKWLLNTSSPPWP